jgi:protein kinase A/protein kinase X
MDQAKLELSKNLENSISAFEMITKARGLRLALRGKLVLDNFIALKTLGTGTFGRVKLVKFKEYPELPPMALKILKKKEMIKLKQIEHIKAEKNILSHINHPFIVEL